MSFLIIKHGILLFQVELEAVKEAYEAEIDLVIADARGQIGRLEVMVREAENALHGESEKQASRVQQEAKRREEDLQARLIAAEKSVMEERTECQNVRDLLIQAQNDIEKLRGGENDELSRKSRELHAKAQEVDALGRKLHTLEFAVKDRDALVGANSELTDKLNKSQQELSELKESLEGLASYKDELAAKNRQLESDVKHLKREMVKREKHSAKPSPARQEYKDMASAGFMVSYIHNRICSFYSFDGVVFNSCRNQHA